MDNDDPDVVAATLEFMYTATYTYDVSVAIKQADLTEHAMTRHLQVYALVDNLQTQGLKSLAQNNFEQEAVLHWDHPAFPQAVQSVYAVAPPGLRGTELRESSSPSLPFTLVSSSRLLSLSPICWNKLRNLERTCRCTW